MPHANSARRRGGLRRRLARRLSLTITLVLLAFVAIGSRSMHESHGHQLTEAARHLARQELSTLEHQLDLVDDRIEGLASSTLLKTALVDGQVLGRSVPSLLRDLVGDSHIEFAAFTDFRGRVLQAEPSNAQVAIPYEALAHTLAANQGFAAMSWRGLAADDARALRVVPIRVDGTPQGLIIARIDLPKLLKSTFVPRAGLSRKLLCRDRQLLQFTKPGVEYGPPLTLAPQAGTLAAELELALQVSIDARVLLNPVLKATLRALAIGLLVVAAGVFWCHRIADRVARPVEVLCQQVLSRDTVEDPGTQDELEDLAAAFNQRTALLIEAKNELEQRVEERTHEIQESLLKLKSENYKRRLAEKELRGAIDAANAASQAKSDFLANMSHEIRTPMTAILGYGELLSGTELDAEERARAVATISHNGEHLMGIINDILDLSKVESGQFEVEIIPTHLRDTLSQIEELMRVKAEEKQLQLTVNVHDNVMEQTLTDPTRLRQVLLNLVSNAIKFTSQGMVSVTLRNETLEGQGILCFEVRDTGVGIPPELQKRLFQPFSQADTSTTREFGGTGLGLFICKRLTELLDGKISMQSVAGQGSVFSVRIPALEPSKAAENDALPAQRTADVALLNGARVLVVEDGLDNQRLIQLYLNKVGAEVTLRANGFLGLEEAWGAHERGAPYDVIVMDMQMPVMSGYEAVAELRMRGYRRPIVALTANAMREDRARCLDAGCDAFATKPMKRQMLLETIAGLLTVPAEEQVTASDG